MSNETHRIAAECDASPLIDAAIAGLAAGQLGLVAFWQLTELGIGRGAIELRVRQGRLHRVHRGVYLVGHAVLPPNARELAAVLACGPGAVASHHAAGGLWGMVKRVTSVDVRVTVPGRRVRSREGIRPFTVKVLDPRDRRMLGPVPVTAPARTLIDLAGVLGPERLEPLIADAQGRRLLTRRELERAMDRAPHRAGVGLMRPLIQSPKLTRREGERRLLKLIRAARLPEPECNAPVGPYVVDFLWSAPKLIVEFDSKEWHGDQVHGRFESDRRRDGHTLALGYATKRVTWRELTAEPRELTALLRRLLEQRTAR